MRKGFTLIELLAVIVILAIIALIAVPIVLNIINDTKKESVQRSIDLYMDMVQKQITGENMKVKYDPDRCEIQGNGNVICYSGEEALKTSTGEEELKVEMNGKKPESGTIILKITSTEASNNNTDTNSNKITYTEVVLEGMEYTLKEDGTVESKEYIPPIPATGEDYRGYYADVDGDGKVDGVIYADLNKSDSGQWGTDGSGTYSYAKQTGLKEYIMSSEKYTEGKFGKKEIISIKKGSRGKARFYVMALNDFTKGSKQGDNYYWYKSASGKMNTYAVDTKVTFGTGYTNTGTIISIWNAGSEGKYNALQNDYDIFKHIQEEYRKGWYIPSKEEWSAFADYFTRKTDLETKLASNNYNSTYGLSIWYWSSSQNDKIFSWCACFYLSSKYMFIRDVSYDTNIRLGITF